MEVEKEGEEVALGRRGSTGGGGVGWRESKRAGERECLRTRERKSGRLGGWEITS